MQNSTSIDTSHAPNTRGETILLCSIQSLPSENVLENPAPEIEAYNI